MTLAIADIRAAATSDQALLKVLSGELDRQLPMELLDDRFRFVEPMGTWLALNKYVAAMRCLPPGLRAMAATYQLDVSMALDDLGWHFANWHHMGYCDLTSEGLRELEATEAATLFDQAYALAVPHWDQISALLAAGVNEFGKWYHGSSLSEALGPLNERLWQIAEESTEFRLMRFWLQYARRYPERVATEKG